MECRRILLDMFMMNNSLTIPLNSISRMCGGTPFTTKVWLLHQSKPFIPKVWFLCQSKPFIPKLLNMQKSSATVPNLHRMHWLKACISWMQILGGDRKRWLAGLMSRDLAQQQAHNNKRAVEFRQSGKRERFYCTCTYRAGTEVVKGNVILINVISTSYSSK